MTTVEKFRRKLLKYIFKDFKKHPTLRVVTVSGTSNKQITKRALASLLASQLKVHMRNEEEASAESAMVSLLGVVHADNFDTPDVRKQIIKAARQRIHEKTVDLDVIVQELPANSPGDVSQFAQVIRPSVAVVTAVEPQRIRQFQSLEAVANEILSAANMAEFAVINRDAVEEQYVQYLQNPNLTTYGSNPPAEFWFEEKDFSIETGYRGLLHSSQWLQPLDVTVPLYGDDVITAVVGAVAAAYQFGITAPNIVSTLAALQPITGQMQLFKGDDNSVIIDDTLHVNPIETVQAIRFLYRLEATSRIAVLGSLPELGQYTQLVHQKIGETCNPDLLSWVITVGPEAEQFIAPTAKARGCQVKSFQNTLEAGAFAHSVLEPGGAILYSGSSAEYLEEALKIVLHDEADESKLVRQTPNWLQYKAQFFSKFS